MIGATDDLLTAEYSSESSGGAITTVESSGMNPRPYVQIDRLAAFEPSFSTWASDIPSFDLGTGPGLHVFQSAGYRSNLSPNALYNHYVSSQVPDYRLSAIQTPPSLPNLGMRACLDPGLSPGFITAADEIPINETPTNETPTSEILTNETTTMTSSNETSEQWPGPHLGANPARHLKSRSPKPGLRSMQIPRSIPSIVTNASLHHRSAYGIADSIEESSIVREPSNTSDQGSVGNDDLGIGPDYCLGNEALQTYTHGSVQGARPNHSLSKAVRIPSDDIPDQEDSRSFRTELESTDHAGYSSTDDSLSYQNKILNSPRSSQQGWIRKRKRSPVRYRAVRARRALPVPRYQMEESQEIPGQISAIDWLTAEAKHQFKHELAVLLARLGGVASTHQGTCVLCPADWRCLEPTDLLHVTDPGQFPARTSERMMYKYSDYSTSFDRAFVWFLSEENRNGGHLDNFLGYGEYGLMDASHLCYHEHCLVHITCETADIRDDRRNCAERAKTLRREGQVIPIFCTLHDPPCLMQKTSIIGVKSEDLLAETPAEISQVPDLVCKYCPQLQSYMKITSLWAHVFHKHPEIDRSNRLEEIKQTGAVWSKYWQETFSNRGNRKGPLFEKLETAASAAFSWKDVEGWNLRR
ncbi:MAG: hypothetical protein Q9223_006102 [Gallowayella weberi]